VYVLGAVILILTAVAVYVINIPALLANETLITAISPSKEGAEKNLEAFKKIYSYNSFGSTEATEQLVMLVPQIAAAPQVSQATKQAFYNLAAQKIVEKVAEVPHDARYLVFAGGFFNNFGNFDEAIKYLERAAIESPKKQSIYFNLGSAYLGKGDKVKALEQFKKAYDFKPESIDSRVIYALGAIYTGNTQVLNQMLATLDPNTVISDNRFVKAYADTGNYTMVINILNKRLETNPNDMQSKLSLASAYSTIGQKQKAISLINEMIAQNPSFKAEGEGYIKQIQAQ
jgi:tetratricopeptide (TPR) repeat protein